MSEYYIPPPPPYELSLQRDQKISEELQELELSKKRPTEGEEDSGEWGDNKDSKVLAQKALMEVTVKPLRIQKRPAASNNAAVRGPRPLPQRPTDASLRSPQGQGNRRRCSPMLETKARETEQDHMTETYSPAPPPFSAIAPPLVGPPYEWSMLHPNTSAAPSPLNSPLRPSFDASRQSHSNQWSTYSPPEPRTDTSFRRTSHAPFQSTSSSTPPRDRNFGMRLAFDPSVAYSNSQADAVADTREMSAAALYSSAVSSHLDPGSRQSYIGPANRYATYARSSISISTTTATHSSEKADISPTRSRSSFLIDPSPYTHTSKPRSGSGYEYRWATSESDVTRDLYHRD